jgi:hypothetical protein
VALLLADRGVISPGLYTLPVAVSAAALMQAYHRQQHIEELVRALPPLAVLGACGYDAVDSNRLAPALLLIGVGLTLLPLSRRWQLRSHLWIGIAALVTGVAALAMALRGEQAGAALAALSGAGALRLLPLLALLVGLLGALLPGKTMALFPDLPPTLLAARARDCLAFAALAAGLAAALGPVTAGIDQVGHLLALAAVAALGLHAGFRDGVGWPLLLAGGNLALIYVYLRARTDWLDGLHRWDALVAVGAGGLMALLHHRARTAAAMAGRPEEAEHFPLREVGLVATGFTCLAAIAFFDLRGPLDAVGPLLAAAVFLVRGRSGIPGHDLVAALFANTTVVLLLLERQVSSPSSYAIFLAASAIWLLHRYRDYMLDEEGVVRSIPAVTAGFTCVYDALHSPTVLLPILVLIGLGLALLLLSRRWQVPAYLPVGLACVAAALVTTITHWNERGWTASALAVGTATLLFPVLLLRRRWRGPDPRPRAPRSNVKGRRPYAPVDR